MSARARGKRGRSGATAPKSFGANVPLARNPTVDRESLQTGVKRLPPSIGADPSLCWASRSGQGLAPCWSIPACAGEARHPRQTSGKLSGYARGRKGRQQDPAGAASPGLRLGHGAKQQLTFSCKTPPRSLRRELIMTVAAREQFLSGSAKPSNMASRRLISWSGGTRFPIT